MPRKSQLETRFGELVEKVRAEDGEDRFFGWVEEVYFDLLLSRPKPTWDQYFLRLARFASSRSSDKSTKHGCIIVDEDNRLVSMGYNGTLAGIDDTTIPQERPAKYFYFSHAEENATLFAQRSLKGCTAYITGYPCPTCFRILAQAGIKRVVFGKVLAKCVDLASQAAVIKMARLKKIALVQL